MYIAIQRVKDNYPTLLKTLSFACVHFATAFSVAWLISGSMLVGGLIALIEPLINTGMYYIHERCWQREQLQSRIDSAKKTPDLGYVACH